MLKSYINFLTRIVVLQIFPARWAVNFYTAQNLQPFVRYHMSNSHRGSCSYRINRRATPSFPFIIGLNTIVIMPLIKYVCRCYLLVYVTVQKYSIIDCCSWQTEKSVVRLVNRRPYWWGGVVNLFWHVTAFNQSDYSIDQSNCRTALTCQNKFTTPPHQYGRLWANF